MLELVSASSSYFTIYTKINSRQILEVNLKAKTVTLQEENTFMTLEEKRYLLYKTQKVLTIEEKNEKSDII